MPTIMRHPLTSALALTLASSLAAQNCIDRNYGTAIGLGDDTMFAIQPIGFAFPLNGTTYTDVHVCTNGYVFLSNAGVPLPGAADYSATTAELASGSPRLAPFWTDLDVRASNGGQCYVNATASMCTVTWSNAQCYALAADGLPVFTFQLQMLPSGQVQFFYEAGMTNHATTGGATLIGACSGGGATLPTASDLSLGGATPDPTIFEELTVADTFDLADSSVLLLPGAPGWSFVRVPFSGCASTQDYGTGCVDAKDSLYEFFAASSSFDLAGKTISMLRTGTGYFVTDAMPGSLFPHVSPTVIAAGDDIEQTVTLSSAMPVAGGTTSALTVCSNGRIALASTGNGVAYAPVVANFLAFANTTIAPFWHDLNPTAGGSGSILFEQAGGFAYVTWNGVYSYNTTSPNYCQCQFDLSTGDITLIYDAAMVGSGGSYLVGYSVGGASPDSGPVDLSTALAASLTLGDLSQEGLALTGVGLPTLGNSSFAFSTTKVPPVLPLAFLFFGTGALPGIDLGFLGMPGCNVYTTSDLGSFTFPVAGDTGSLVLPIPNSVGLIGLSFAAQSLAFSLMTPANLVASNGTQITIGM